MENQTQQDQNQSPAPGEARPDGRQFTKKERQHMRRQERQEEREKARKTKGQKNIFAWMVVFALVAAGGFGVYKYLSNIPEGGVTLDPFKICVNHGGVSMHIHPELSIVVNKKSEKIRTNIGISGSCMRAIHTHDSTGRLHNEFPQNRTFTLGEFFNLWDKPFSSSQILDYTADDAHVITMTVNGQKNTDYENLILRDRDRIEIRYETVSDQDIQGIEINLDDISSDTGNSQR